MPGHIVVTINYNDYLRVYSFDDKYKKKSSIKIHIKQEGTSQFTTLPCTSHTTLETR